MRIPSRWLMAAYFLFLTLSAAAQCTLPGNPSAGTIDSSFDTFFKQNGPGWTGGDSAYSVLLPDGRNLWVWSDSYIGTVNSATRLRKGYLFQAHNSLTIQDQVANTLTTVGYPTNKSSYFKPANQNHWFWVGDSMVYQPSAGVYKIAIFLLEFNKSFAFQGNSVATLSWPSLSVDSIVSVALPDTTIDWGSKLFLDSDGYYYIYGLKDPGSNTKTPYLARTTSVTYLTLPSQWQYWSATSNTWVSSQASATPMSGLTAVTPEYTVNKLTATSGPFYLMTTMDPLNPVYPNWKNVTTYYACSPQGPWSNKTTVYTAPEAGAKGCKTGNLVTYNAKAHPEFTGSGILMTYNVNALVSSDLVCANDYIPRWIRVSIPGVTPGQ